MRSDAAAVPRRTLYYAVLVIVAVLLLFPLVWMVITSLKPEAEIFAYPPDLVPSPPRWQNYADVFSKGPFARQAFNSVYISTINVLGTLVVASLAGYAFARIKFPGRSVLFVVFLSALLVPVEVLIVPLYGLFSRLGWVGTQIPLLVEPVFGAPAVVATFVLRQFFISLPRELDDAGRVDGLSRIGLFWYIALPLARPVMATAAILTFLASWNSFLEPLVFTGGKRELWTLPVGITQYVDFTGTPFFALQMAASTLASVPVILVFLFAQRYVVEGITHSGLKG